MQLINKNKKIKIKIKKRFKKLSMLQLQNQAHRSYWGNWVSKRSS
tara:strand:- start:772 stop:906 length:135 start_codon:yes stop_codon:yes gene_type:complete